MATQNETYERLRSTRVDKALHTLTLVGNLSDRRYNAPESDKREIVAQLATAIKGVADRFRVPITLADESDTKVKREIAPTPPPRPLAGRTLHLHMRDAVASKPATPKEAVPGEIKRLGPSGDLPREVQDEIDLALALDAKGYRDRAAVLFRDVLQKIA